MSAGASVHIRERRGSDLPRLIEVLAEQQPSSRYPFRWPLPFPVENFIARDHELAAWVAEVDGQVVGHVCVQSAAGATSGSGWDGDELGAMWSAGHGRPVDELAIVAALFTSLEVRGAGVGGVLLDTAVAWMHDHNLGPCLDVIPKYSNALAVYERRGWRQIGEVRPPWLPDEDSAVVAMVLAQTPRRRKLN